MATKDRVSESVPADETHRGRAAGSLAMPSVVLDVLVGATMLGVASWFWLDAASIQTRAPSSLAGPVAFPRAIAALLAVCSLLMIGRSIASRMRGRVATVKVERPVYVVVAMALMVGYPVLIEAVGYYIGTGLWLPVLLWVAGYRRPLGVVLVSAGFLAFTKVVFQQMLGTPLP